MGGSVCGWMGGSERETKKKNIHEVLYKYFSKIDFRT